MAVSVWEDPVVMAQTAAIFRRALARRAERLAREAQQAEEESARAS